MSTRCGSRCARQDRGLLQGVEKSVRAAEVNDSIHDERRRVNSADANLLIGCHERRFTPVGMIKKGHIELSITGKHPSVVLLGLLDLKIPEQIASFRVARFQRPVQHADEKRHRQRLPATKT